MKAVVDKFLVSTASNIVFRVFNLALSLAAVPVLITQIGDDGYGLMILVTTLSGFFTVFSVGAPTGTVKFVAEAKAKGESQRVRSLITTSLLFFFGVGLLVSGGLALFVLAGGLSLFELEPDRLQDARWLILAAMVFAPVEWSSRAFSAGLEGLHRYNDRNIVNGLTAALATSTLIVLAILGFDVVVLFAVQRGYSLLRIAWLRRYLRRRIEWRFERDDLDLQKLKRILSLSVWIMVAELAAILFYSTDEFMIGTFYPVAAIAVYRITVQPFRFIQLLNGLLTAALLPTASAIDATESEDGRSRFLYLSARYGNAAVAALAIPATYLTQPGIRLWVGEEYLVYVGTAQAACLFQLLWQSNGPLGQFAFGSGKAKRVSLIAISIALLNLVFSYWWARDYGPHGVIWATVAAGSLGAPLQYAFVIPQVGALRWTYFKSVVRGQAPLWLLGAAFLPFWTRIQEIDTVLGLVTAAAILGTAALLVAVFSCEAEHRNLVVSRIRRRLGR